MNKQVLTQVGFRSARVCCCNIVKVAMALRLCKMLLDHLLYNWQPIVLCTCAAKVLQRLIGHQVRNARLNCKIKCFLCEMEQAIH